MSDPPDPVLAKVERCRAMRNEYEAHAKTENSEAWFTVSDSAFRDMLDTQATTNEGCVALIDEFFQCNGEMVDDHTRELLRNLRNYLKAT